MNSEIPFYIHQAAKETEGQVEIDRLVGKDTNGTDVFERVSLSAKAVLKTLSKPYKSRSPIGKTIRLVNEVIAVQSTPSKPDSSLLSDDELRIELEKRGIKAPLPEPLPIETDSPKARLGRPRKEADTDNSPLSDESLKTIL